MTPEGRHYDVERWYDCASHGDGRGSSRVTDPTQSSVWQGTGGHGSGTHTRPAPPWSDGALDASMLGGARCSDGPHGSGSHKVPRLLVNKKF